MADWRTKIGEEFTSECNNLYKQYYEDTPIKCLQRQTHCDNLVFAAIHKCFVSRNLINADAKLQVHLTLDSLLQDFQITINEISKRGIFSVNIEGGVHYHCNTLNNTVRALQSKLNNIQPLHLRGYSGHYSGREYKDTWDDIFFNAGGPDSPWYKHQCHALQCLHFIICPDGDMDVVLRTNTVEATYRVCSHQLRASSSVFRNSISPARVRAVQELGGGHRFRIALKVAHDTTALAVVFFVVHASVTRLPDIIPFAGLVVIAAVCNYYNCAAALAPWDGMWISQLNYANSRSCSLEYHDLLFVAWVFGQEQIFGDLTKLFAQKVFIKDLGIVVSVTDDMKDVQNFHHSLPQAVIGELGLLQILLDACG
jgi:hypothetical protein